ncbi:cellulase family glycosylhydrolase [Mycobacterium sp. MMS18-G62]
MRTLVKSVVALVAVAVLSATAVNVLTSPSPKAGSYPVVESAAVGSIGFADSDMWGYGPDDVNHAMDLMLAAGVHSVRVLMPWAGIQPDPNTWDWGQVDLMVGAANARGMSVIGILNSSPGWAAVPGTLALAGPPADMATYGDFAAAVAGHFRGRVAGYEVWNEPNSVMFWATGAQGPDAALYTQMLKTAYPRIKAADPGATVIGGVLGWVVSFGSLTVDPVVFLQRMYDAGAAGSMDALSFHPYHYGIKFSAGRGVADSPMTQLEAMRGLMVAHGDGGKKIWATEYGEPTSSVDEATQADYIRDFLTTWRSLPYTGPAFIYTLRDRNTGSGSDQDTLGVYRTDWTPKPAVDVIRSLA